MPDIKGQYTIENLREMVQRLNEADAAGATRKEIIEVLQEMGKKGHRTTWRILDASFIVSLRFQRRLLALSPLPLSQSTDNGSAILRRAVRE